MKDQEVPQWRDGERGTPKDLLIRQEAARDRAERIACPKLSTICAHNDHLIGFKGRVGEAQVRIAAAASSLMYEVGPGEEASEEFGVSMTKMLGMCAPESQPEERLPFLECSLREWSLGRAPIGYVKHYTYVKEKRMRGRTEEWYEKDLYVLWRGSHDFMDFACDANISFVPSQDKDVQLHGGMFARFFEFKEDIEKVILDFLEDDTEKYGAAVNPRRIYFAGHSLGAGLATVTHFQLYAAQQENHWPSSQRIRDFAEDSSKGVFMIGFAGPPVFAVKKDAPAPSGSVKRVLERGINFAMEYDVIPRVMNVQYCKAVLKSCYEGELRRRVDSPLLTFFYRKLTQMPLGAVEEQLDKNADIMCALQHLHPMFLQYVDKAELWQWTVLDLESLGAFSKMDWLFESEIPMSTLMPLNDHSVFPSKLDKTWHDDFCSVCGEILGGPEAKWQDCLHCQATFCPKCFDTAHRDPPTGEIVSWHAKEERSVDDKRRNRVTFPSLGPQAAQFLNDMRYNAMLVRLGADVFKPGNIWLVADLFKEGANIGELVGETPKVGWSLSQASSMVSKVVGPGERNFVGAMLFAETGWICYKRWAAKELDCSQFWVKLLACWASAGGTIGGLYGGPFVGGLIGSIFGPVGAVIGALVGSAVGGAVGGAYARYKTEELIKWAMGLSPEQKEKANWGIISQSMHKMGFRNQTKPSELTSHQVKKAFLHLARLHHPDKTGLIVGQRTRAEEEKLALSYKKFHESQSHYDTLSAFIDARDRKDSVWTQDVLRKLDIVYIRLLKDFDRIDEDADIKKAKAATDAITNVTP